MEEAVSYKDFPCLFQDAGDFATVAYFVLKPRLSERGTMTIAEVNHCLDEVALSHANKSKDGVRRHLLKMLKNMSAMEQKWLIRMIMKELKVGLSQQSVFSVFHQDAEDVFNVKMSLEKVEWNPIFSIFLIEKSFKIKITYMYIFTMSIYNNLYKQWHVVLNVFCIIVMPCHKTSQQYIFVGVHHAARSYCTHAWDRGVFVLSIPSHAGRQGNP